MATVECPVLLRTTEAVRSSVYLCVPMDPALASRSAVMSEMMSSGGLKELPDGVTMGSFQAWCKLLPRNASHQTPEVLASAIQTAAKMGDSEVAQRQLARGLARKVSETCWTQSSQSEHIQLVLDSMTPHLRAKVLRECLSDDFGVWSQWPLPLQHEFLNMCVSTNEVLTLGVPLKPGVSYSNVDPRRDTHHVTSDTLSLLSRTTPGLHTLLVPAPITTPPTAVLLSQALLHHTTLCALSLPSLAWHSPAATPSAQTIYLTLPRLSLLTSLTTCLPTEELDDPDAVAATLRALAAAVTSLPALASAAFVQRIFTPQSVSDWRPIPSRPQAPTPQTLTSKRPRLSPHFGRCTSQPSLDPLVTALSTAPALTALSFLWIPHTHKQFTTTGIHGAFTALRRLHLHMHNAEPTAWQAHGYPSGRSTVYRPLEFDALPALRHLSVQIDAALSDVRPLTAIIDGAAKQPSLKTAEFTHVPCWSNKQSGKSGRPQRPSGRMCVLFDTAMFAIAPGVSEALAALSRLTAIHTLNISFCDTFPRLQSPGEPAPVPSAANPVPEPPPLPPPWPCMLNTLPSLRQVRDLEVRYTKSGAHSATSYSQAETAGGMLLDTPLGALTQLTALTVRKLAGALHTGKLARQLTALTRLRRLSVAVVTYDTADEIKACLAPLTALRDLKVKLEPVNADVARAFAASVVCMPQLRVGSLVHVRPTYEGPSAVGSGRVKPGWAEGLRELPGWGRYEFTVGPHNWNACEEVRQVLIGRGARVSEGCGEVDFTHDMGSA